MEVPKTPPRKQYLENSAAHALQQLDSLADQEDQEEMDYNARLAAEQRKRDNQRKLCKDLVTHVISKYESAPQLDSEKSQVIATMIVRDLGMDTMETASEAASVLEREAQAHRPDSKFPLIDRMYELALMKQDQKAHGNLIR